MPVFRVFHTDLEDRSNAEGVEALRDAMFGEPSKAIKLGAYREVARVESRDLANVFPLTNHIDCDWTENSGILAHAERVRSTSMGDVVQDEATGALFSCASFGWDELDAQQVADFEHILNDPEKCLTEVDNSPSPQ